MEKAFSPPFFLQKVAMFSTTSDPCVMDRKCVWCVRTKVLRRRYNIPIQRQSDHIHKFSFPCLPEEVPGGVWTLEVSAAVVTDGHFLTYRP